jgi:hypothetical protein
MKIMSGRTTPSLLLVVGLLGGCSSKSEQFQPVKGKVLVGGQPIKCGGGAVILVADASKGNTTQHEPRGALSADGDFEIMTIGQAGAPPGWYKVVVMAQDPASASNPYAPPKYIVTPEYLSADRTPLSIEVVAKPAPDAYKLEVKEVQKK